MQLSKFLFIVSFVVSVVLGATQQSLAAGKNTRKGADGGSAAEEAELVGQACVLLWGKPNTIVDVAVSVEKYKLEDVDKLLQISPSIVLNAAQVYARLILSQKWENGLPYKEILDPTYRGRKVKIWKAFSGIKEANGRMIVDQYRAVDEVVQFIIQQAYGAKSGLAKLIVGPPGTGKTELLYILDLIDVYKARRDQAFGRYSFRWKNLGKIPNLQNALIKIGDGQERLLNPGVEHPPVIALFPDMMKQWLVELVTPQMEKDLGIVPQPKAVLDAVNDHVLNEVLAYEVARRGRTDTSDLTAQDYMDILSPYVEVYKFIPTANKDERIVPYLGPTPKYEQIFLDTHMMLSQFYPGKHPLSQVMGQIPNASGGGLLIDEMYRNEEEALNLFLDLIQNGRISYNNMSARGDFVILAATNDESKQKAIKNSQTGAGAGKDRDDGTPMRQPLQPHQAAKIAMLLVGPQNFYMRDLRQPNSSFVIADINELYTHPDEKGKIIGPEGRYEVLYAPQGPGRAGEVFIAPRALTYLGLVAASTRIVTDPKMLDKHKHSLSSATYAEQFILDPVLRMQVAIGDLNPDGRVRAELEKARYLFEEGTLGITARDTDRWFKAAMTKATERHPDVPTLTPAVVMQALKESLDSGKLEPKAPHTKIDWMVRLDLMTEKFLKNWLAEDLRAINSGDPTRLQVVYNEVAADIETLSSVGSEPGETADGDKIQIDFGRYSKIREIYKRQNYGRELVAARVATEHLRSKQDGRNWAPLYKAVEEFIMEIEIQTGANAALEDYFSNKQGLSPQALEKGQLAEAMLPAMGYNRQGIRDALAMLKQIRNKEEMLKAR